MLHVLHKFFLNFANLIIFGKTRGGALGWGIALHAGKSRVWFWVVSLEFFIDLSLPAALWPSDRLSLQQEQVRVPGIFYGSKGGRCWQTCHFRVPIVL